MRAISPSIFLLVTWAGTACSPDLGREAGSLEIQVLGAPTAADILRARVSAAGSETTTQVSALDSGGRLFVESVPAGKVDLEVLALKGASVLQTKGASGVVVPGETTRIPVNFQATGAADGGTDDAGNTTAVESSPILALVDVLRGSSIVGDQLIGSGDVDGTAFDSFVLAARAELGRDPSSIRVSKVVLVFGTGQDVSSLDQLWDETVTVALESKDAPVFGDVASGTLPMSSTRFELTPTGDQTDLDAFLLNILERRFTVKVRGRTPQSPGGSFQADVNVLVSYVAAVQ